MEDKPKKKWMSSRLKDKKKELGIEDKPKVEEPDSSSSNKKPFNRVSKKDFNDRQKGTYEKKYSGDAKKSYEKKYSGDDRRNSYRDRKEKFVIKISNLPRDITVQELNELISPWGDIGNINIKNYSETCCSYIDFYRKDQASYFTRAIDSTPFDAMIIRAELMDFSKPKV